MKKIVVIGGGTGSFTALMGLKNYDVNLTAIVSTMDDGGSTGRLRDEFGVLPPGDIRRCIVALSNSSEMMKNLFQYRFINGGLKGHSFGNLFITALKEITGSDEQAIKEACRILSIKGNVLPVTLDDCRLCAELEDGQIIKGEANLDVPKHDGNLKIKKLFTEPAAFAFREATEAIRAADLVVIGPGDLYGSIIVNLLVKGLPEAIKDSKAKKLYVCNVMTKFGETNGFKVINFVEELEKYLGKDVLDYVLANDVIMDKELLAKYELEKKFPVMFDDEELTNSNIEFIKRDLICEQELIRHDSRKLARAIMEIANS
jgi:uncharacterized cofD-like protein